MSRKSTLSSKEVFHPTIPVLPSRETHREDIVSERIDGGNN